MFITTAGGGMIAATLMGGLLGGGGDSNSSTQTSQNTIDPRMADYLYGAGGLLGSIKNLYGQQSSGGLNPMQLAGLEMQRQTYTDPAYGQGMQAMRSMGNSLLGQGVAGNPFTGGSTAMPTASLGLPAPAAAMQPLSAPFMPGSLAPTNPIRTYQPVRAAGSNV